MQAGLAIGSEGTASLGKMDISTLNDAPNFMLKETRKIGNDTLSIWAKERLTLSKFLFKRQN